MAAPLVLSQNIRNLSNYLYETYHSRIRDYYFPFTFTRYTNVEVIKVDQDPMGKQGTRIVGGELTINATSSVNTTNVWGTILFFNPP